MIIIIKTASEELGTIRTNVIKNQKEIEMKILMLEEKIKIKRIWHNLDEFKINELKARVSAEMKTLKKKENIARKIIISPEKSKLELGGFETIKTVNFIAHVLVEEIKNYMPGSKRYAN